MDSFSEIPYRFVAYLLTIGAQVARAIDALKEGDGTLVIVNLIVMVIMLGFIWVVANLTIKRRDPN